MIFNQVARHFVMLSQQAATNGQTLTSLNLDRQLNGVPQEYVSIALIGTTSNNATNVPVVELLESDTTVASTFAAVAAGSSGTYGSLTVPAAPTVTQNSPYLVYQIDLRQRKRYLQLQVTPVTSQTFTAHAIFSGERAAQGTSGTTPQNAQGIVTL